MGDPSLHAATFQAFRDAAILRAAYEELSGSVLPVRWRPLSEQDKQRSRKVIVHTHFVGPTYPDET